MREHGTPAWIVLFRSVGAEPTSSMFDVAASIDETTEKRMHHRIALTVLTMSVAALAPAGAQGSGIGWWDQRSAASTQLSSACGVIPP